MRIGKKQRESRVGKIREDKRGKENDRKTENEGRSGERRRAKKKRTEEEKKEEKKMRRREYRRVE